MRGKGTQNVSLSGRRLLLLIGPFAAALAIWVYFTPSDTPTATDALAEAAQAVEDGRIEDAYRIVKELHTTSSDPEVLTSLAAIEAMRGDPDEALRLILQVPDFDSDPNLLMNAAQYALEAPRLSVAEDVLRKAVARNPGNTGAIRMLSALQVNLMDAGQVRRLTAKLDQMGEATAEDILVFCSGNRVRYDPFENTRRLTLALEKEPDQGRIAYALSMNYIAMNRLTDASDVLEKTLSVSEPRDAAMLDLGNAEIALIQKDYDKAALSLSQVGEELRYRPQFWLAAGRVFKERENQEASLACYKNAATLAPYDPEPLFAMSRLLRDQAPGRSVELRKKYQKLQELSILVQSVISLESLEEAVERIPAIVAHLIDLEAWREARTCLKWLQDEGYRSFEATEQQNRLKKLVALPPLRLPLPNLRQLVDVDLQQLDFEPREGGPRSEARALIFLSDSTLNSDIGFRYIVPDRLDRTILSSLGAGVGILDLDNDAQPDLFFPQAADPKLTDGQTLAGVYLKRGEDLFDASSDAIKEDNHFFHGVCQADINNDGFDDLVVTGFNRIQLLLNNGDGTLSEGSADWGLNTQGWSVSSVIADFDNDGHPDLYVVNYLDAALKELADRSGQSFVDWGPIHVPAKQDQLYRGTGTGGFQNVSESAGVIVPDGKGLGVVAADFDRDGRLDIFVSNDTSANRIFFNESVPGEIRFEETSVPSGVAFGTSGQPEASMGIAVADVDRDGLQDLFVTNFESQTNTLYSNLGNRRFSDETERMGLGRSSFPLMGWGAKLIDLDGDGALELITLNGHLNKSTMQPTLQSLDEGVFRPVSVRGTQYFNAPSEGRSLAAADLNGDLLPDLVVTHRVGAPLILENNAPDFQPIQVHLVGTNSDRSATGAEVTLIAPDGSQQTSVLSASDHFLSGSQPVLTFRRVGDGPMTFEITWPGGSVQEVIVDPLDDRVLIIEANQSSVENQFVFRIPN